MAVEEAPSNGNGAAIEEPAPAPGLPDYVVSPNAVFKDEGVQWRYGRAPDYSKTRKVWEEGKSKNHAAGSLEEIVENLVKNWEVEASFKPRLSDWRTIDHENYSFAMGGNAPQSAEHMIKVGTYNGIIAPNEYYSPENSDFASSHKTFKRMMPTFAWEVLEVYSGPPRVSFRWRHWGYMKNDYVGFNDKGQKVTAKAHGGIIDIEGVTVAEVDDKLRMRAIQTWMDPLEMFRQIAPKGVVNKETMNRKVNMETALDVGPESDGKAIAEQHNRENGHGEHANEVAPEEVIEKHISNSTGLPADAFVPHQGTSDGPTAESTLSITQTQESKTPQAHNGAQNDHQTRAQAIVETSAIQGASIPIEEPESNYHDAVEHLQPNTLPSSEIQPADHIHPPSTEALYTSPVTGEHNIETEPVLKAARYDESKATGTHDALDQHLESSAEQVHPQPKDVEMEVEPKVGEGVVAAPDSEETRKTHEEMSRISAGECPFMMNRE